MDIVTFAQAVIDAVLQSYTFGALKVFLGIYSVVLVLDLALLFYFTNFDELRRQRTMGSTFVPSITKSSMKSQWSAIEKRLKSGNASEYKVAILEADKIVEKILGDIGYNGNTDMKQKIEHLNVMQPEDAAALDEVHKIRNRIVFEQDFHLDLQETEKYLEIYKTYLKKFDYFE